MIVMPLENCSKNAMSFLVLTLGKETTYRHICEQKKGNKSGKGWIVHWNE